MPVFTYNARKKLKKIINSSLLRLILFGINKNFKEENIIKKSSFQIAAPSK